MCIDSTLAPGHLSYGELVLPGEDPDGDLCLDPRLPSVAGRRQPVGDRRRQRRWPGISRARPPRYTLRFLFAPGTIGAITWLARNREVVPRIRAGLTLTCLGDAIRSRTSGPSAATPTIDRAAAHVLARRRAPTTTIIDFFPYGYDERQYNSPGFRLPVGSLMRGRHGQFPEYHTSADNLAFVSAANAGRVARVPSQAIVDVLDGNRTYRTSRPYGEPQLGRRGLYRAIGGTDIPDLQLAMLWVLNLSDGEHDLLDIAEPLEDAVSRSAARRTCSATAAS